jgi:hypothetical protein
MARITDGVELTTEERVQAALAPEPTRMAKAIAAFKASQEAARKMGILAKPVTVKGMSPREAIYAYAEDTTIPEEQRVAFEKVRNEKLLPVEAANEAKLEANINLFLAKEEFVNALAHERKLELAGITDAREARKADAALAKAQADAAKAAGKLGVTEELKSDPKAGQIPAQDESPVVTAAQINADVKAAAENAEREALLDAVSGKGIKPATATSGSKNGSTK